MAGCVGEIAGGALDVNIDCAAAADATDGDGDDDGNGSTRGDTTPAKIMNLTRDVVK